MYNPIKGLPGKNVKLSEQQRTHNSRSVPGKRNLVDSLGITVNTNVGRQQHQPPQQIFPAKDRQSGHEASAKRRNPPPKPLNLGATPFSESYRRELRSGLSPPESRTPVIIVTPTEDETPEIQAKPQTKTSKKPRASSSIYTVAPLRRKGKLRGETPIATFPTPPRIEGATPPFGSNESFRNRDLIRRSSTASAALPTPNRTSGWWNVITSPFATHFSGVASTIPTDDSVPDEQTPLCGNAAPITHGGLRGLEDDDIDSAVDGGLHSSAFRNYTAPMDGEASKYYNPKIDFSTPALLPAGFSTPAVPQSARSMGSDTIPFSPDDQEFPILLAGEPPQVMESSKKVPEPQIPSQTPPKSSCAAVIEKFTAMPTPSIGSRAIDTTPPQDGVLSPLSPSPIVQTASVGKIHSARSVHAEGFPTLIPTSISDFGNARVVAQQDAPQPAFRIVANDDEVGRDVSTGYTASVHEADKRIPLSQNKNPTPAFRFVADDYESSRATSVVSRETAARGTPPRPYAASSQPIIPASRHLHTQSQDSNYPLMPEKANVKAVERYNVQKPRGRADSRKKRTTRNLEKFFLIGISVILFITTLLAIVLCMTLSQDHSSIPVESHWLNLTGYPPLPTGISTISRPRTLSEESGCVEPREMWSCALPKGQQQSTGSSQPDFRLLILSNNQTVSDPSLTQPERRRWATSTASPAVHAHSLVRRAMLNARDTSSDIMFTSLPAPPSLEDQEFLGNTTDSAKRPFAGEETPFYLSFLPTNVPVQVSKRSTDDVASDSVSDIPPPSVNADGSAAAAQLHPWPEAQPLRLFNRGLPTEHYGFYSYFDKSIFLYSPGDNSSDASLSGSAASINANGGAKLPDANVQCTWSQTRFLVQIWTRTGGTLLSPMPSVAPSSATQPLRGANGTASAFDFSRPGSFPWPVTVTADRHGGDPGEKGLYCYGLNADGEIVVQQKALHDEDRGYGGTLVNPAPRPFADLDLSVDGDEGYGGVDGGSGGCSCQWANW